MDGEKCRFVGSRVGKELLVNSNPDLRANLAHAAIPMYSNQLNALDFSLSCREQESSRVHHAPRDLEYTTAACTMRGSYDTRWAELSMKRVSSYGNFGQQLSKVLV